MRGFAGRYLAIRSRRRGPGATRTRDTRLRGALLCPLSYRLVSPPRFELGSRDSDSRWKIRRPGTFMRLSWQDKDLNLGSPEATALQAARFVRLHTLPGRVTGNDPASTRSTTWRPIHLASPSVVDQGLEPRARAVWKRRSAAELTDRGTGIGKTTWPAQGRRAVALARRAGRWLGQEGRYPFPGAPRLAYCRRRLPVGTPGEIRTRTLPIRSRMLGPSSCGGLVGAAGFEPATSAVSRQRSARLSYAPTSGRDGIRTRDLHLDRVAGTARLPYTTMIFALPHLVSNQGHPH